MVTQQLSVGSIHAHVNDFGRKLAKYLPQIPDFLSLPFLSSPETPLGSVGSHPFHQVRITRISQGKIDVSLDNPYLR